MEPQIAKPLLPSIFALFCAVFSCFFTPSPIVPVPSLPPRRRLPTHGLDSLASGPSARLTLPQSTPKRSSTPLERDKTFLADSDTNVRQMRRPSALENPSPATDLSPSDHPYDLLFRPSSDTKLPPVRQHFPSWFRYDNETMRQFSATKISPQLRFWSHQLRTCPLAPCFHSYGMSPQCDNPRQADSDTTMRQARPRPPRADPAQPERLSYCYEGGQAAIYPVLTPPPPARRGGNFHV